MSNLGSLGVVFYADAHGPVTVSLCHVADVAIL